MGTNDCVVAIDIGTQSTRAALVALDGTIVDIAASDLELLTPRTGWAEQRPADWWSTTCANLQQITARHPRVTVLAVAVGAAMHGVVPVDAAGVPLLEAVGIWCDKRGAGIAEELAARDDAHELVAAAGNPPTPAWWGIKAAWYQREMPGTCREASSFLVVKDFLNMCLTGVAVTDPTEASGSFLLEARSGVWSDQLCEALGMQRAHLPDIAPSAEVIGSVTDAAARATGLVAGTPVVAGAGDMLCQLAATGLHRADRVTEISGTASIIAVHAATPHADPRVLNLKSAAGGWVHFGISDAAGVSMRWMAEQLYPSAVPSGPHMQSSRYDAMTALAAEQPAACDGLVFLPYLLGERTLGSPAARGALVGLTPRHTRATVLRAVMEGICFDGRMALDLFRPEEKAVLRVTGGGSTSELWNRIRADVYGLPVARLRTSEGGLVGAAILALVGAGCYADVPAAADAIVHVDGPPTVPGQDIGAYAEQFMFFRAVHDALAPVWQR